MTDKQTLLNHRRILIIDDNPSIHDDFRKILCDQSTDDGLELLEATMFGQSTSTSIEQYEVESATQGQEGLEKVRSAQERKEPFALAFVDMRMPPGWDGLETIEHLWEVDPELQIVICSAYSDHSREEILERTGRSHRLVILKKPFDNIEIAQLACAMTEKWRASKLASLKLAELEEEVARRTKAIDAANARLNEQVRQLEQAQNDLHASEERFALAASGSNDGLWDWDLRTQLVYYSERWKGIVGLGEDAGDASPDVWFSRVHPDDLPTLKSAIGEHLRGTCDHLESEHRLLRPDGNYAWVLCRGATVRDTSGRPYRFAGSLTDIGRMKETEAQLRHGAYYDRLTGLPNRTLFKECLERSFKHSQANPNSRFAVVFIDCDRFKLVNDSLGHLAGDQLLLQIATRLTKLVQGRSVNTLARLGGDEFVLLIENVVEKSNAVKVAQSIHELFELPFDIQGHTLHTTASIGIAMGEEGYLNAEEVLRDADTAMYHAKSTGRAQNVLFNPSMRAHIVSRLHLENDLRRAISAGEIGLVYQPIICLRTNRVVALEALARWNHSEQGLITPDRFITIAEETGMIIPLGELVMRKAVADLHTLQRSHGYPDLHMNVNLSSKQLSQASLVSGIVTILKEFDVDPTTVCMELTESAVMDNLESAKVTMQRLRELGTGIALDDFGTGYSSLSSLRSLPLTSLKLDRSFVAQMGGGYAVPAIIHAIVTLANHLGLQVVAEGIESAEQIAGIIALECDFAQGYLISRPMPLKGVVEWLAKRVPMSIAA